MSSNGSRAGVHPEDYFRILVEQAADGIFIASQDGVYLEVNPSGHRLLGYPSGELVGKRIADIVLPRERARLDAAIAAMLKGEVITQRWVMVRKDGSLIETEVTAQRLSNGRLLGIVRDLRARTDIEDKVRASEAQLRSILETAPDVIMAVDRAGKILFINRTLPPLAPAQVVGTICFDYVPPEARGRVEAALDKVFSTGVLDEYEVRGPPGPDGVRGWSSVRAGPLMDGDRVVAAILCATNVTARRLDEATLRRRQQAVRVEDLRVRDGPDVAVRFVAGGDRCAPVRGVPDARNLKYRLMYGLKNLVHRTSLHQGSSGVILCWRKHFMQTGGFDEGLEVRENSELIRRLMRFGKYRYIQKVNATTSMRRYHRRGCGRMVWLWVKLWVHSLFGDLHHRKYETVR